MIVAGEFSPRALRHQPRNRTGFIGVEIVGRLVFHQDIADFLSFVGIRMNELDVRTAFRCTVQHVDYPKLVFQIGQLLFGKPLLQAPIQCLDGARE
jgi:hypothetical protein